MRITSFYFIFFIVQFQFAQYTEVINSKRPGFSESPYSIGTNVYQVEGGVFYQKSNEAGWEALQQSIGTDWFLRTGLLSERLEFSANFKLQNDEIREQPFPESYRKTGGISQFTIGAKYMIYKPTYKNPVEEIRSWKEKMKFDKNRLIPAVGVYAGWNTNVLNENYKLPSMGVKAALLLQNDFDDYTTWVNNIYADNINLTDYRNYGYISTLSYAMTDRFLMFAEHQGTLYKDFKEFKLGGGMAYLFNPDMQVGVNLHWDMHIDYLNLYGGVGFSWRYDNHKEKFKFKKEKTEEKKDGSGKIQTKKSYKKKLKKKKK